MGGGSWKKVVVHVWTKCAMYFTIKLPHSLHGMQKSRWQCARQLLPHENICHINTSANDGKKPHHVKKQCKQGRSTHIFLQCELEFTVLSKILPQDFVVEVTIPYFAGHTVMHDCFVGRYIHMLVDVVNPACNYIRRHFTVWPHGLGKITQLDVRRSALNDSGSVQT